MVKRAAHLREGGKWTLPGGFVDRDETVVEAALREVREESGWVCHEPELVAVVSLPDRRGDDRQNVSFLFAAEAVREAGGVDDEVEAAQWWSLDALPDLVVVAFDHGEMIDTWRLWTNDRRIRLT